LKEVSQLKKKLLRELSENSRATVTVLAGRLKCSRNTIANNIEALENEFDVCYTLEFNRGMLGLIQNHVWSIKFGVKPTLQELKKIFEYDGNIQRVTKTEGDFDMTIYVSADSGANYIKWGLKTITKLLKYRPKVEFSMVALSHTGFTPVPNSILKNINLENLAFDELDREILLLLNENSRRSFKGMAKSLKIDVETVRYRIKRLVKLGVIRRFTMILLNPPTTYNMAFFVKYEFAPGLIERYQRASQYYKTLDAKLTTISTFQYLALLSGASTLYGIVCFKNEEEAMKMIEMHREIYKEDRPTIIYSKITEVIMGHIPIRNMDIAKNFVDLNWKAA
jgi:DNA-binding Lrp family transcriptional regulator